MKTIITIFLINFTLVATGQDYQFIGTYLDCKKKCLEYTGIEIEGDGTFKMFLFCDVGGFMTVEGTWTASSDTISLSTNNEQNPKYEVATHSDTSSEFTTIQFFSKYDSILEPIMFGELVVNDTIQATLDINGMYATDKVKLDKLKFRAIGATPFECSIETTDNVIKIIGTDMWEHITGCTQEYSFKNKKYILEGKLLIPANKTLWTRVLKKE